MVSDNVFFNDILGFLTIFWVLNAFLTSQRCVGAISCCTSSRNHTNIIPVKNQILKIFVFNFARLLKIVLRTVQLQIAVVFGFVNAVLTSLGYVDALSWCIPFTNQPNIIAVKNKILENFVFNFPSTLKSDLCIAPPSNSENDENSIFQCSF